MNSIELAQAQVEQAAGLTALLEASYAAFLLLLPVIEHQQDPSSRWFRPFVMAGSSAACGRFAVLDAPSTPASVLKCDIAVREHLPADATAAAVIALSQALAIRLDSAAIAAGQAGDREACGRAARHARNLCARLGGTPPP